MDARGTTGDAIGDFADVMDELDREARSLKWMALMARRRADAKRSARKSPRTEKEAGGQGGENA